MCGTAVRPEGTLDVLVNANVICEYGVVVKWGSFREHRPSRFISWYKSTLHLCCSESVHASLCISRGRFACAHDRIMAKKGSMAVDQYLIAVAVSVMVAAVLLMLMTKEQRDALLDYGMSCMPTVTRQRRISSSKTPPRSVSPEKKVPNNGAPSVDYQDIFPPSPRELMAQWAEQIPPTPPKSLHAGHVDPAAFRKGLIPFAADYRECGPSTYTPTQFSVEEIKALGDFPDYAELSGVPRPEAYTQFTIKTARARPYRPFRWAYHQTMCRTFRFTVGAMST